MLEFLTHSNRQSHKHRVATKNHLYSLTISRYGHHDHSTSISTNKEPSVLITSAGRMLHHPFVFYFYLIFFDFLLIFLFNSTAEGEGARQDLQLQISQKEQTKNQFAPVIADLSTQL